MSAMYHVHYQIGDKFGDMYVSATSWPQAVRRAKRKMNPKDARWASFCC